VAGIGAFTVAFAAGQIVGPTEVDFIADGSGWFVAWSGVLGNGALGWRRFGLAAAGAVGKHLFTPGQVPGCF
jgi:hypothetical protein